MEKTSILKMKNIMKIYSNGVVANKDVNFELKKGEIHALLGENGAGKSTLMKILFGSESFDKGEIILKDTAVHTKSPSDAISKGIGMVHQHFMLVPSLTIAENIVLGMEPRKNFFFFDKKKAIENSQEIASKYNFDINVNEKIENIPVGMKQKVEILKALYRGAEILILDEPTAVLTSQETRELFIQLKTLRNAGHSIIFISHKLDEIKEICDTATIMKNGVSMGTYNVADISTQEMSRLMVGRDVVLQFDKKEIHDKREVMNVSNLNVWNSQKILKVDNLSFSLKSGEILGIAGVEGNGQSELIKAITGLSKHYTGDINIQNQNIKNLNPHKIRDLKLSHIPEDRMTEGFASNLSIMENIFSNQYENYSKNLFLKQKEMNQVAENLCLDYDIKCSSHKQNVGMLSGGNIQKVVVAREFSVNPEIIIANQPTRGIDVGAIEFIRKRLIEYRENSCAILLVSADLSEILSLSDKIAIMYKGKFTGIFENNENLNEEILGQYMLGIKSDIKEEN